MIKKIKEQKTGKRKERKRAKEEDNENRKTGRQIRKEGAFVIIFSHSKRILLLLLVGWD
jgi:hypothetical protein